MKSLIRIFLGVGFLLMIYGYWGAFTNSGNKLYDEMDGFIPFFLLIGGVLLFLTALILNIIKRKKAGK